MCQTQRSNMQHATCTMRLYQNSSTLQISHRVPRKNAVKETQNSEIKLQRSKDQKAQFAIGWLLQPIETTHFRYVTRVHTRRSLCQAPVCLTFSLMCELCKQLQMYSVSTFSRINCQMSIPSEKCFKLAQKPCARSRVDKRKYNLNRILSALLFVVAFDENSSLFLSLPDYIVSGPLKILNQWRSEMLRISSKRIC